MLWKTMRQKKFDPKTVGMLLLQTLPPNTPTCPFDPIELFRFQDKPLLSEKKLIAPTKIVVLPPIQPNEVGAALPGARAPKHDAHAGTKCDLGIFVHQLANPVLQIGSSAHA
jgi:hypothetical protein